MIAIYYASIDNVPIIIIDKPTGGCSVLQPEDYTGTITIKCTIHYNPSFIDAKWKLQSTNQEFSGYPTSSQNVTTYYSVSQEPMFAGGNLLLSISSLARAKCMLDFEFEYFSSNRQPNCGWLYSNWPTKTNSSYETKYHKTLNSWKTQCCGLNWTKLSWKS